MKRKIISLCLIMGLYMMLDTVFVNAEQNTLPAVSEEMIEKTEYAESPSCTEQPAESENSSIYEEQTEVDEEVIDETLLDTSEAEQTITDICKAEDGDWYYYVNGEIDYSYTGFAENINGWWYLEGGKVIFSKTRVTRGIVNGEDAWWNVKNGKVIFTDTVAQNEYGWWRIEEGKVNFKFNGFAENENGWWYLEEGKVIFSKTRVTRGTVNGVNAWWNVRGGQIIFNDTLAKNEYGWWRIEEGKVNFQFNGFAENEYGWWYLEEGKVIFSKTRVTKGTVNGVNAWWNVVNGQVIFANTLAKNENGWWYIENGKVNFTYTDQLNSTSNLTNSFFLTNIGVPNAEKTQYGTSAEGRPLYSYTIGNGKNHLVLNFAIHGWEDNWARDSYELFRVAIKVMKTLSENESVLKEYDFSVTVIPCANPDGIVSGYTNNGPGRCSTYRYNSSDADSLVKGGVDMNRCFPAGFKVNTSARNYTGSAPLLAKEARELRTLIDSKKGSKINLFIDVHGWTQQILTNSSGSGTLYKVLHQYFPSNTAGGLGGGYVSRYAMSIGYQACLFEFPRNVTSYAALVSNHYDVKFANAVMSIIKSY